MGGSAANTNQQIGRRARCLCRCEHAVARHVRLAIIVERGEARAQGGDQRLDHLGLAAQCAGGDDEDSMRVQSVDLVANHLICRTSKVDAFLREELVHPLIYPRSPGLLYGRSLAHDLEGTVRLAKIGPCSTQTRSIEVSTIDDLECQISHSSSVTSQYLRWPFLNVKIGLRGHCLFVTFPGRFNDCLKSTNLTLTRSRLIRSRQMLHRQAVDA